MEKRVFDLEERLLDYSVKIIQLVEKTAANTYREPYFKSIAAVGNISLPKPWRSSGRGVSEGFNPQNPY